MSNKHIGIIVVLLLIVGVGAFYGGVSYGKNQAAGSSASNTTGMRRNFRGFSGNGQNGGVVAGSIVSKTDSNLIVQLREGGSKLIFITPSTAVKKMVDGSLSDLATGEQVFVNGQPNSDGSISAQTIQIRAASSTSP